MKKKKKAANVVWQFATKPPPKPMVNLPNGEKIVAGIVHEFRTEGMPATRLWCTGCGEFFKRWSDILWRHGMRSEKPIKEKKNAKRNL